MIAIEIGRLDFISILLTIIAVIITFLTLLGFGYIRWRAEEIARDSAEKIAKDVADRVAKETIAEYRPQMQVDRDSSQTTPFDPGEISTSQVEPEV